MRSIYDNKVPESTLWTWMTKARPVYRHRLHVDRIENLVSSGHSDVSGVLDDGAFFIELKTAARPAGKNTRIKPKFRPKQVPWLEARWKAGGASSVLLQVGCGTRARRYLIKADPFTSSVRTLAERGLDEFTLELYSVTSPTADPAKIFAVAASIRRL